MIEGWENALVLVCFWGLMVANLLTPQVFKKLRGKNWQDWCLDLSGLSIQGILIPLLQITLVYALYHLLLPTHQGSWHLSQFMSFLISFVVIDYLYYWNHRLLHQTTLWCWHQVHHTVTNMDVLGTSRNTVWTSFLILYLWLHPLFIYLLNDSTGYLIGVSLTSALDLWRHSSFYPQGWLYACLNPCFILPQDHTQHHANEIFHCNYGANLKWWDQWHGTYKETLVIPEILGIKTDLTLIQKLFYPIS